VVDGDGGVDVDVQPVTGIGRRTGRPRLLPGMGAGRPDPAHMGGIDLVIDQPPHRGRRGGGTEGMLTIPAALSDPVDAVRPARDRSSEIGEHRTWGMSPRATVGIGQHRRDLRREPAQVGDLPQHRGPGMRHDTRTVGGHFHPWTCCAILHLRSAFPLA
jgi:hypothetical protein